MLDSGKVDESPDKEGFRTVGTEHTITGSQKKKVVVHAQHQRALHRESDPDMLKRAEALSAQLDATLKKDAREDPSTLGLSNSVIIVLEASPVNLSRRFKPSPITSSFTMYSES